MYSTNKSEPQEISVKEILKKYERVISYLKSKAIIILICGFFGAILGLGYAFYKKTVYTATCTFVLDDNKGSGLSQYAGLASFAGIDLGGGANGGVFEGDNIMELYRSRNMIVKTLLSEINENGKKQLLIDRYIDILGLRKRWKKKDNIDSLNFQGPFNQFNRKQDSIIIDISTTISNKILSISKPDKKLNIIKVEISFVDELFAKEFNNKLVTTVNDFYSKTKTKKELKNVNVLQSQVDSVRVILNSSIGGVASSIDANPNANPALFSLRVTSQRRQIDVQTSTAVYAELIKNLELAKMSLRQETPLIQVIDEPVFPLSQNVPNKILFAIGGFFLTIFASGFVLLIIGKPYNYKSNRHA